MSFNDEDPTRPIAPVADRRSHDRKPELEPFQPSPEEITAAVAAANWYGVSLGIHGRDAVRRMLVAAARSRAYDDGLVEIRGRVEAHLATSAVIK